MRNHPQKCQCHERWLRNCSKLKDTKKTYQLNAVYNSGLDPVLEVEKML